MTSSVMQRLHNVRQLGLAHLVYPGANYSRFSHSVGACNIAGGLLSAVERNSGQAIDAIEYQAYRLVALLHDIGHYPFSHATEVVVSNYYARGLLVSASDNGAAASTVARSGAPNSYQHEPLGEYIIRHDDELGRILKRHGFEPDDIADKFAKAKPDPLIGVISSDLDCDRLDYLKRTAHNSGAPYGSVDIRFLIDQATTDLSGQFCFKSKAARAADHLLVSRFYDYMQVPFNKTVAALEWSLTSSLRRLLEVGELACSGADVEDMVKSGRWKDFDDQHVIERFRALNGSSAISPVERDHIAAILDRRPAKLIAGWDEVISHDQKGGSPIKKYAANKLLSEVAQELSLDERRLFIWDTPVYFTKLNIHSMSSEGSEEIAESVLILDEHSNKADLLARRRDALIHRLCSYSMAGLRLYYLPENGRVSKELKKSLIAKFSKELGSPVLV
ncbi:MAG: HD domain-containing protein [Nitratireductor sp.]|uniref:HD domain-containing protein n=1 Tax=Nitratireductor sp. TaxID=1872084 RepID=UPI0026044DC9|nr:HD domain-containing protein [Nitratireductor sp.]MCV0352567.1 HD domain-containing protein [Nitratireductor sp.]